MTLNPLWWLRRLSAIPPLPIFLKEPRSIIRRPRDIENPRYISLGRGTRIREHSWISAIPQYAGVRFEPRLEVGEDVYIGRYVCITCTGHMWIGDGVVLSEHVYIADSAHGIDPRGGPIMRQPLITRGPVRIGAGSFIGYGARILPGVTLGEHCVVGANSVVTRSFGAFSMVAGAPAKLIKRYNHASEKWDLLE